LIKAYTVRNAITECKSHLYTVSIRKEELTNTTFATEFINSVVTSSVTHH